MIMALAFKKTDFVKLLLEYGVSIKSLLTRRVLEFLYWFCASPLVACETTAVPVDSSEDDDGFLQSLLMSNHDSRLQRRKLMRIPLHEVENRLFQLLHTLPKSHIIKILQIPLDDNDTFASPFRQLFIWAVLNNLLDMAILMWSFEDDGIALALLATEITMSQIKDTQFFFLPDEEKEIIQKCMSTFSALSIEMLDECYKTCEKDTALIVTDRLKLFNEHACCIEFAFLTQQMQFVAHTAVQGILERAWHGSITKCDTPSLKVFGTIFCPLLLINMDIQSQSQMAKAIGFNSKEYDFDSSEMNDSIDKLSFVHKFYNFHAHSPLVRFLEHTVGYVLFLMLFSYVAMCDIKSTTLGVCEIVVIVTVIGYFVEEIYQIVHADESPSASARLRRHFGDVWNLFDCLCILVFVLAVALRCNEDTMDVGQLFYAIDVSLWWVRLIQIMYAHPITGLYVVMIGQMLSDMFSFLIILLIFLLSYGIAMKAMLAPGTADIQMLVQPFFYAYFNIYGQYFIDTPSDNKTTWFGTTKRNEYAEPITFIYLMIYLLIANVLLLNLLIAIFGNTFGKVMESASLIWKFQRYSLIVEYAERSTVLWPPFSLLTHMMFFVQWLMSKCSGCIPPPNSHSFLQPKKLLGKLKCREIHELEN